MEDQQKTVVVEKRLSKGVIRRRARPVPAKAAEPVKEEKKTAQTAAETTAKTSEQKKTEKKAVAEQPVLKKQDAEIQPSEKHGEKKKTKEAETKRFVLSDEERQQAQERLQKKIRGPQQEQAQAQAQAQAILVEEQQETPVLEEGEALAKQKVQAPKPEEKPKILSFKDRIRGHIDLKKPDKEIEKPKKEKRAVNLDLDTLDADDKLSKAEKLKEKKGVKVKKGVKAIGGDLDVYGDGRLENLSQIVRTAPLDRVFRPGETGRHGRKKKTTTRKSGKQTAITVKKASKRVIHIENSITVGNLAQELGAKAGEVIKKLMELGIMATINQEVDKDTAALIAGEYQYEVRDASFKEEMVLVEQEKTEGLQPDQTARPPVVTVMGHVDHGKTSLLDKIRSTNVVSGEAGGITQHIGAYTVVLDQGKITFLDTPGHEAFTAMRLRGAQATDIVVLVVAADDGIMPQTEESIAHAKAAGVPIIVAINKIDKPEADADKIKRQLAEKGLVPEDWGGDVICNLVSAKKGTGIDSLLDNILLQAEMLELKARFEGRAQGVVLEAKLDKGRGPVSTLLVQEGTLKNGDYVVAGLFAGRVKNLLDWKGDRIELAEPSTAVEVLGLEGVPEAGDAFYVVASEKDARAVVENRLVEKRRVSSEAQGQVTLEDMFLRMKSGEISELSLILKTDVHGSLEAVRDTVMKLGNEEVKAKIIHTGVGGINESDVQLAMTSKAIIIGFNIRPDTKALHLAKETHVDIRLYKVIYELVNDVKLAMQGLLTPFREEVYLGRAEVRQVFEVSKVGMVAGCLVTDGLIKRTAQVRLLRDNVVVYEGTLSSLKRFKDDARDVKQGFECGMGIQGYNDIKPDDIIEAYEIKEIQKTL